MCVKFWMKTRSSDDWGKDKNFVINALISVMLLSNGFLLLGSFIRVSSAWLEAADHVVLGRIKMNLRKNCMV